jgi:GT2 family glycosyltransferase
MKAASRKSPGKAPATEQACAVVVNWNRRDDTLECLTSLYAATSVGHVIVVDNGSTDGSAAAIHERFPDATVLQPGRNLGFAAGSNLGAQYFLEQTPYGFLFLLNNDLVIAQDTVERLVDNASASRAIGVTVPKIYYTTPSNQLWYAGGYIDWRKGTCEHYGFGQRDKGQFDQQRDVSFACGGAELVKREVVERLGLFQEWYYMFEEDVEFSIRVQRADYAIRYVPTALAWHKVGASAASRGNAFVWYYLIRNRLYTMRAHANWHQWLGFWTYLPLLCVWKSLWYALQGQPAVASAIARGVLDFARNRTGEAS